MNDERVTLCGVMIGLLGAGVQPHCQSSRAAPSAGIDVILLGESVSPPTPGQLRSLELRANDHPLGINLIGHQVDAGGVRCQYSVPVIAGDPGMVQHKLVIRFRPVAATHFHVRFSINHR